MGAIVSNGGSANKDFYTIAFGKLNKGRGEQRQQFETVYGRLIGISIRNRDSKDANGNILDTKRFLDLDFRDGNEFFCISGELYGSNMNRVLQFLVPIQDFMAGDVYVSAWPSRNINPQTNQPYTNVSVRFKGPADAEPQKIEKVDLPGIEEVYIPQTGETVKSRKRMMETVDGFIRDLQARLAPKPGFAPEDQEEDMPEDTVDPRPQAGYQPQGGYGPQPGYQGQGYQPQVGNGAQSGYQGGGFAPQQGQQGQQYPGYPQHGNGYQGGGYQGNGYNGGNR